ncbi:MAG TPA: PPC domain-containing DNA-binding protein [Caldimonas sp.]|nr:PPC domain-containing DNA-binding protein [Caldimonas sp.]
MDALPIRLSPGEDLRRALEAAIAGSGCGAGFVLSGIGSLTEARLRFAGADETQLLDADLEILTLAGSVSANGSHLHATLATPDGRVVGGHLGYGCIVRTTAEVLVALLDAWDFSREHDAATGYDELAIRRRAAAPWTPT